VERAVLNLGCSCLSGLGGGSHRRGAKDAEGAQRSVRETAFVLKDSAPPLRPLRLCGEASFRDLRNECNLTVSKLAVRATDCRCLVARSKQRKIV